MFDVFHKFELARRRTRLPSITRLRSAGALKRSSSVCLGASGRQAIDRAGGRGKNKGFHRAADIVAHFDRAVRPWRALFRRFQTGVIIGEACGRRKGQEEWPGSVCVRHLDRSKGGNIVKSAPRSHRPHAPNFSGRRSFMPDGPLEYRAHRSLYSLSL